MSVSVTQLPNGMTVASDAMPELESATVGVWVNCGSRHETPSEMGLSHMLEHMAFKGTELRTAKGIATEIEAVGGELNAYTGREQTAYHARVLKDDVPLALDIISDILLHPAFAEEEIARERDVIIQEIGQARDTPDDIIFDYLQMACYPGQSMGWPILGSEETVSEFSQQHLRGYMRRHYRAGAMTLIAAGAVDHGDMVRQAEKLFSDLPDGGPSKSEAAQFFSGERRGSEDLEQAHLAFAFAGLPISDPDAIAAQVFATALGGGMSSRLFQEIREKRGLCYAIAAFASGYSDTGMLGIYAGTARDKAGDIAPLIANEIMAMASDASEEETARAKAQLKASLLMARESPSARCEQIATHLHAFGRVLSVGEIIARIDAVEASAVRRVAARICGQAAPSLASVGPAERMESREIFAARFARLKAGC